MDCRGAPFSRVLCPWNSLGKNNWSGLPFPSPGIPPNPGIKPGSPSSQAGSSLLSHQGSPRRSHFVIIFFPRHNTFHFGFVLMITSRFYSLSQSAAGDGVCFLKVPQLETHTALYPRVHWLCLPRQV